MCVPINYSKKEAHKESIQDDESTLSQNDEESFELCHREQEEMITEEIKEISKCKNQFVDIKGDEIQSHST